LICYQKRVSEYSLKAAALYLLLSIFLTSPPIMHCPMVLYNF